MPLLLTHHLEIAVALIIAAGLIGTLGVLAVHLQARVGSWRPFSPSSDDASSRHCRYCCFGRSSLRGESVRVEGDDLIEVKCYVCRSCGLPHWTVDRSPVLKKAA